MAKINDPSEPLDYRLGGETWDSFSLKYMKTIPYIFKVLNALNGTDDTGLVLPEPEGAGTIVRKNADGTVSITITGNAATANKFKDPINIRLVGGVVGTASLDGSSDVVIQTSAANQNAVKIVNKTVDDTNIDDGTILVYRQEDDKFVFETKGVVGSGKTLKVVFGDEVLTSYNGDENKTIDLEPVVAPSIENDEYLYVVMDPADKVVFGIKRDGSVDWQKGTPQHVIDACNPTMENDEYLYLIKDKDSDGNVIFAIRRDGSVTWQKGVPKPIKEAISPTIENDEYAYAMLDADGHVLFGVKRDGFVTWQKGTPQHVIDACNPTMENDEYLYAIMDTEDRVAFGVKRDGSVTWGKGIPKFLNDKLPHNVIENDEFVSLVRDNRGKIIEGITIDGTKKIFSPVTFCNGVTFKANQPNAFSGKYVSIMGDSISTYVGTSNRAYATYYPRSNPPITSLEDMWWKKVINHFGMNLLKNVSISGSKVTGDSTVDTILTSTSSMPGCCDYRINDLADGDISPDIVLVYMGVNDTSTAGLTVSDIAPDDGIVAEGSITDFAKAYDLMLYKIKYTYPNATVYCANLPWYTTLADFPYKRDNGVSHTMQNKAIREACEHIGAHYVDFYSCHRTNQTNGWDIHLTREGMTLLANAFIKKIESTY